MHICTFLENYIFCQFSLVVEHFNCELLIIETNNNLACFRLVTEMDKTRIRSRNGVGVRRIFVGFVMESECVFW